MAQVSLFSMVLIFLQCCFLGNAFSQSTQSYPSRPIRIIVPYAPGGLSDVIMRMMGPKMTETWGQQVIVDNRPGGATNIGSVMAAKAAPDGYVLLAAGIANAINPSLYKNLEYDPVKDFSMISIVGKVPVVAASHPSVPVKNIPQLIALAKKRPTPMTFGTAGNATSGHLAGELLKVVSKIQLIHVPYKGAAPAISDLIGGQIELYFGAMSSIVPHTKTGRARALGIASLKRSPSAPDIPTFHEQGIEGFETTTWYGVAAPAGTPKDIILKLNGEFSRIVKSADIGHRMATQGIEVVTDTADESALFLKAEIQKWEKVVKLSGATVD